MIPPKPRKPPRRPTDLYKLCARVPAKGKNATPHRNIFNSGSSAIFTTRAATYIAGASGDSGEYGTAIVTSVEIAYPFFVRNPNPPRDISMHATTSFPNASLRTHAK